MLRNLRANVELLDGDFGNVYLDNARPYGMSERIFRSCLSRSSSGGLHLIWHSERRGRRYFYAPRVGKIGFCVGFPTLEPAGYFGVCWIGTVSCEWRLT